MAFRDEMQKFLEDRLLAYDPTIDISSGSPAQTQIITPILDRLGEDPFSQDTEAFVKARLLEAFPDLQADDGGVLGDLLANPLKILLDPFKQQIEVIKLGQSLDNADLMSDEEVDALAANWFESRKEGELSTGTVRVYFSAPTTVQISDNTPFYTASGLVFFPTDTFVISADQMLFNRQGDLYYVDVTVVAEAEGQKYNIGAKEIVRADGITNVVKMENPSPFNGGSDRESTPDFVARVEQALTERSLVTKRGVLSRVNEQYNDVRAVQVVGAGEGGMDRDILVADSDGQLHIAGNAILYGSWLFLTPVFLDDGIYNNVVPEAGDTVKFYEDSDPQRTIHKGEVSYVIGPSSSGTFLLILKNELFTGTTTRQGKAAVLKPSTLTISDAPGGISDTVSVANNEVHIGGHSDVFIRPASDSEVSLNLESVVDETPIVNTLSASVTAGDNVISLPVNGVQDGDLCLIESGLSAGVYRVLEVDAVGSSIRVDSIFSATESSLRARVLRNSRVSLEEPKTIKLPFDTGSVNDLTITIGSTLFKLSIDSGLYGVEKGDILRVLEGPAAGDYTITGFDPVLGGQGIIVDRAAPLSAVNVPYTIFSSKTSIDLPLINIKSIELLGSSNQSTGIKIPYGAAVDVRTKTELTGAENYHVIEDKNLIILPDTSGTGFDASYPSGGTIPQSGVDAPYTLETKEKDGPVVVVDISRIDINNTIHTIEVSLPSFLYNGKRDTLLALTTSVDTSFTTSNAGEVHYTSPLAQAKKGDSLIIQDGPNAGSYTIKDIRVVDYWAPPGAAQLGRRQVAFIQIEGEFATDPLRTAANFAANNGNGLTTADWKKIIDYANEWSSNSGFKETLAQKVWNSLTSLGFSMSLSDVSALLDDLSSSSYMAGPSARGIARVYFQEPASTKLESGLRLQSVKDPSKSFVIDEDLLWQVYPESENDDPPSTWSRIHGGSQGVYLYLTSGESYVKRGVRTGDILEYRPAINELLTAGTMESSLLAVTSRNSNIITILAPNSTQGLKSQKDLSPGQILFLDSGPDEGMYTITDVLASDFTTSPATLQVKVDRVVTHTTDVPATLGAFAVDFTPANITSGEKTLVIPSGTADTRYSHIDATLVGSWITIFAAVGPGNTLINHGNDTGFLGSYEVTSVALDTPNVGDITITFGNKSSTWPQIASSNVTLDVLWIAHKAPLDAPADGQISDNYIRVRLYDEDTLQKTVTIDWAAAENPVLAGTQHQLKMDSPWVSNISTDGYGHKNPHRIIRRGERRISSTSMSQSRENSGLYYIDVPIRSEGTGEAYNIPEGEQLVVSSGMTSEGYLLETSDYKLAFSIQEKIDLILPPTVLPVGSTPGQDNEVTIGGQSLQLSYITSPLIGEIQSFFDSPLDRVVTSDVLVRHFLPAYVLLYAEYSGGSSTSIVAQDLIDYINNLPVSNNQLRTDEIVRLIQARGASTVNLPLKLVALVQDASRKVVALQSTSAIGNTGEASPIVGPPTAIYFIAGTDTSSLDIRPDGPQVFLVR